MTTKFRTFAFVIAATLSVATLASAQQATDPHHPPASPQAQAPAPGMMGGMMQGGMMAMMRDCPMMAIMMGQTPVHAEGRVAFIRAELAITDAQKPTWDAFAAALTKHLAGMGKHDMKMMQAKTPVERLDAHVGMMERHSAAFKELKPSLATFYDALSPDQKKKADHLLSGMGCLM